MSAVRAEYNIGVTHIRRGLSDEGALKFVSFATPFADCYFCKTNIALRHAEISCSDFTTPVTLKLKISKSRIYLCVANQVARDIRDSAVFTVGKGLISLSTKCYYFHTHVFIYTLYAELG
jgi:hypothetical protein